MSAIRKHACTQDDYDAADERRHELRALAGGCYAPAGSICDETHCECAQIAFDAVMLERMAAIEAGVAPE